MADRLEELRALKQLAPLVKDLHRPRPIIYWSDLAGCLALTVLGLYLSTPFPDTVLHGSIPAIVGIIVAGLALYRASYFNHELSHQARQLPGFEIGWNLLVGIPLLIPSFLYYDHLNHHSVRGFGTELDIEYFAPKQRGWRGALALIAVCAILPLLYIARFSLLPPLAWVSPKVRHWVDTRASGLGVLGLSRRPPPTADELRSWRVQEAACFVYLCIMGLLLLLGINTLSALMQFYAIMSVLLVFHAIRIMVGHRYEFERRAAGPDRAGARFLQLPEILVCDVDPGAARLSPARAASPVPENPVPQHGRGAPPHLRGAAEGFVLSLGRVRQLLPRGREVPAPRRRSARAEASRGC